MGPAEAGHYVRGETGDERGVADGRSARLQPGLSEAPTITSPAMMTGVGILLGTAAYMSPEQARGKAVDKRSDIWAFGCVLYEMLTGRPLFAGQSVPDTISNVLTREPDWTLVPTPFHRLLRSCLERDRDRRLRDIGDAWLLLDPTVDARPSRRVVPWTAASVAAVAAAIAVSAWWFATGRNPTPPTSVRLAVELGRDASFDTALTVAILSPDGTRVVFLSTSPDGTSRLSTRRLDESDATPLPGTEGAYGQFFSPDGQWIGFFAGGKLMKTRLDGGAPIVLCDAPAGRGASWGDTGRIVAALDSRSGLSIVSASGGSVTQATQLGAGEITHRLPQILPGGRTVLFTVGTVPGNYEGASIAVASLENNPGRAKTIVLANVGMAPRYLPTGHLVYVRNSTLYAVPFDVERLEVRGSATPVLEEVSHEVGWGFAQLDFSQNGTALYRAGTLIGRTVVQWLNRDGKLESLWSEPAYYQFPRLSPDGMRLASVVAEGANADIWVFDWQRGSKTRLSAGSGVNSYPVWSPNGEYIVFQSAGQLYWTRGDGGESPKPLTKTTNLVFPSSFSPDGSRLLYSELNPDGGSLIVSMPVDGSSGQLRAGQPEIFRRVSSTTTFPVFSPDGRWVAYASAESGLYEVYVRAFPDGGRQWPISIGGGSFPTWSRTGNELFYRTEDQLLMVTTYTVAGDTFVAARPQLWSPARLARMGFVQNFDLAPDAQRFAVLMSAEGNAARESQHRIVLNFFDDLQRRVPVNGN
jgi:serine/threonine-protein kinase